jgi:hypothetical protein
MVSTRSSVSNANDAHANNVDADNNPNANANAGNANDANANNAVAADKAEVDPFPVLSWEELSRYIEKQRALIRKLIQEFGLEREVHYTTFNPPFGFVYEGALADLLVLDLIIYEIIYGRERRELYLFYARNFPGGTMIPVCASRYDMEEGSSSDDNDDKDDDDNDNRDNDGNSGKDSKSPDVNRKVWDKRPSDTDATLPLPTSKLARQAEDLRAHLSVFPNGHQGPSGDRLLAEMELELLTRGTE